MCAERRLAMDLDEMWFHKALLAWVWPQKRNSVGPYLLWNVCPFCGGALPDAVTVIRRMLDDLPFDDVEDE